MWGVLRRRHDWAVGVGVAEMRVLLEYLLPLCRVGGQALAQKGGKGAEETAVAAEAITILGGGVPQITLAPSPPDRSHYLVVVPKVKATPAAYPRRPGMAGKRPL